ncbi:MAG TPA: hypothetical protein VF250_00275 [Conexibacter sp.]
MSHSTSSARRSGPAAEASRQWLLSVPTVDPQSPLYNTIASLVGQIRWVVARQHRATRPPWEREPFTGRDVPFADSRSICTSIRSTMVHRIDFCVVLLVSGSDGTRRIASWARELDIPIVIVVVENDDTSPLALASAPTEGPADTIVVPPGGAPLGDSFRDWFVARADRIEGGDERRQAPVARSEPERRRLGAEWRDLTEGQRAAAAELAGLARAELVGILRDPLEFAWAMPGTRQRIDDAVRDARASLPQVATDEPELLAEHLRFLRLARDECGWDDDMMARKQRAGVAYERRRRELEATGASLRKSVLTTVRGWKELPVR